MGTEKIQKNVNLLTTHPLTIQFRLETTNGVKLNEKKNTKMDFYGNFKRSSTQIKLIKY